MLDLSLALHYRELLLKAYYFSLYTLHAVSRIKRGRQRGPNLKTLRSPFSAECSWLFSCSGTQNQNRHTYNQHAMRRHCPPEFDGKRGTQMSAGQVPNTYLAICVIQREAKKK